MERARTAPRTIHDWNRLPQLPLGRHVVLSAGSQVVPVALCRSAGVEGLRAPEGPEHDLAVSLPHVIIDEQGEPRAYRLPLDFGSIVSALQRDATAFLAKGLALLPRAFTFGLQASGAYLRPDGAKAPAQHLRN